MTTDPIADLLTRIRNALAAGHLSVKVPVSKTKERILKVLLDEGYIDGFEVVEPEPGKKQFKIQLRYIADGRPVIQELTRLSKPGRRRYVGKSDIPRYRSGLGVVVVSTSKGMLSDVDARREGVGGELICAVF